MTGLFRLARLYPRAALVGVGAAGVVLTAGLRFGCGVRAPVLRVASFNIRNYPESPEQERGAFELVHKLGAAVVGVQEIRRPLVFAEAARRHLGSSWRFAFPRVSPEQHVGLLLDEAEVELLATRTYQRTVVYDGAKPAFEAELRTRRGQRLRVVVVHLKAGGIESVGIRRAQIAALRGVLAEVRRSGDRVVLLGDFNSTTPEDGERIAELASGASLTWTSRKLRCTSYWQRDGECRSTTLDHVLTTGEAGDAQARGPCESEGCEQRTSCPAFYGRVSDHCPVVAELR